MARLLAVVALALGWSGPAMARTFENCAHRDLKIADAAIVGALDLTLRAAAAVGDTTEFTAWFGVFSGGHGEAVRANLKAIHVELVADEVKAVCLGPQVIDCKDGTYAYVLFDRPRVIHLCPSFFAMPTMADARRGHGDMENGTREGTIIHEMSHFPFIAGTEDECYSRSVCGGLARTDAARVVRNADSYQYFAEDVMLLFLSKDG